ncbi:hypothetical protein [Phreatobacter stygius]|uniref:Uncharacterized protein n=1 Tax=Phreatobacter stygius TaxID=1940610 RepID=A0A4D7AX68_9HYPH|nr:hypothetical protein [Phreatobacter stygius]QCI63428.1 hypothetical protein E8M01_03755 [Phreatobacter stygius]
MKRLIVTFCGIYLVAVALAAATTGHGLIEPVPGYRLAILWMAPETLEARLDALIGARRSFEAMVYAGTHALSWAVIGTLVLIGLIRPLLGPSRPLANTRASAVVLGGLAGLLLLAHVAQPILDEASRIPSASTMLSSLPAYWLAGMALSAAITGSHLSLIVHDIVLWCLARWRGAETMPA